MKKKTPFHANTPLLHTPHTHTHTHIDEAYEILQGMEANGPEPNIYTYNTVTRAFAKAGRLEVRTYVIHVLYNTVHTYWRSFITQIN